MSLLHDIYCNQLQPFGEMNIMWLNEEYVNLSREIEEAEAKINEISPEVQSLFEKYQELETRTNNIIMYHEFEIGCKFGAQLLEELLRPLA